MMNDRDDKFDGQEDSEYHFSDEDISYEIESDSPKHAEANPASTGSKETLLTRLVASKRILISGAVFVVLVFFVYKLVSPTATTTSPEISNLSSLSANAPPSAMSKPVMTSAGSLSTTPQLSVAVPPPSLSGVPSPVMEQTIKPVTTADVMAVSPSTTPVMTAPSAPVTGTTLPSPGAAITHNQMIPTQTPSTPQQPPVQVVQQPIQTTVAQEPLGLPSPGAYPNAGTTSPSAQQQPQTTIIQQQIPIPPAMPLEQPPTSMQPPATTPVATMPAVIPVQSVAPQMPQSPAQSAMTMQPLPTTQQQPIVTVQPAMSAENTAKLINMEADAERMIAHLQSGYAQKLNDYASQNKALQDQVQTLNSRLATMESQLAQLINALTRQGPQGQEPSAAPVQAQPQPEVRNSSYNVQAIIPGRAWLRSESGETVTVAEGDMIKDLGRVTKIDPYDGIVEINTGNKVISLSYGNGG